MCARHTANLSLNRKKGIVHKVDRNVRRKPAERHEPPLRLQLRPALFLENKQKEKPQFAKT